MELKTRRKQKPGTANVPNRFERSRSLSYLLGIFCGIVLIPSMARAQTGTTGTPSTQVAVGAPKTDPGVAFYEVLRGNGTNSGYLLSHLNLLPGSLNVSVAGQILTQPRDYTVDPGLGTLHFTQAISSLESIRVSYRYHDPLAWQQKAVGLPDLDLGNVFAPSIRLYAANPLGSPNANQTPSTYGLHWNTGIGWNNGSNFGGAIFFSTPQGNTSSQLSLGGSSTGSGTTPTQSSGGTGNTQFILQSLAMNHNGVNAYTTYQDVGKNFSDFQALKQNGIANADALAKEKGIRRFGYGMGLNFDPNVKSAGGLSLDWNQIMDHGGVIRQETTDLATGALKFHYATQDISKTFTQFQNLREAEKDQWTKEKGMQTSNLALGLQLGPTTRAGAPDALNFVSQKFGDVSGAVQRQAWNLQSGNFSAMMINQSANAGFKRLNDLADADKNALALDIYQEFDPKAKADQVTAKDLAQIGHDAGLIRNGLRLGDTFAKAGAFGYSQLSIQNGKLADGTADGSELRRSDFALNTATFHLDVIDQATDAKFTRLADLADIEKSNLALDIRKEFDPNATLAQVTQKERDQVGLDAGVARNLIDGGLHFGKDGAIAFSQATLRGEPSGTTSSQMSDPLQRDSVALTTNKVQVSFLDQSIADNFTHLSSLSDLEKAQFANEHGLQKEQFSLNWQVDKKTKFSFSGLDYKGTDDAVQNAIATAKQNGSDPAAAALAAGAAASRESMTFETKGIKFASNWADTAKAFARSGDLALAAPDKAQIAAERGFVRNDWSLQLSLIKNLLLDTTTYHAVDATDATRHDTYKQTAQYTPTKRTTIAYQQDGDITTAVGLENGLVHRLLSISQNLGYGILFNLFNESNVTMAKGALTQGTKTNGMHLETAQNKLVAMKYDTKRIAYDDGKYEYDNTLNVHAKPTKAFSITYDKVDVDRDHQDVSSTMDKVGVEWQATKQFAVVGGVSETETSDEKGNGDTVTVGLKGEPVKNLTLAASFDELHKIGLETKDTADVSISNAKPIQLGVFRNLTLSARYASLNDQRKLQNETMTGRASWTVWKNQFLLDYSGLTNPDQSVTIARTYSVTSDTTASRWFHGSFYYKDRTLLTGEEAAIRRFTSDIRLSRKDHFSYTFGTLPEDEKGNILRQQTEDISFNHTISAKRTLSLFYRYSDNQTTKLLSRGLGFDYAVTLDKDHKIDFGFSRDACGTPKSYYQSNHFRVGMDHPIGDGRVLSMSAELHLNEGAANEVTGHFDISNKF